jgi:aminoglycoside phosphotransferase (APT) family kinase protein
MLPLEVEDCTPEFFSEALEADIERADLLDRSSGTTGRARFALTSASSAVPPTVFVKLAPFDERQRGFVTKIGMGVAEARFYRDLAWEVPVRVPRAFYAETDDDRYVMVLEDLEAAGCWFPNPTDADISARAHDIVEQLGLLHRQFWQSPRFDADGDLSWLANRGTGDAGGGATFVQMAVDNLGDQLSQSFHRMAELYLARGREIVQLWNSGPRTLVHGDPHLGNLFVAHDEDGVDRTGFLDWAMLGYSPGVRDVAYVLCNSIPPDVRAAEERALVARYCDLVGLDGNDGWEQYRLFAVYSWVSATSTAGMGAKWQPLHIGLAGTERATDACEHLDCVGLLERLLD